MAFGGPDLNQDIIFIQRRTFIDILKIPLEQPNRTTHRAAPIRKRKFIVSFGALRSFLTLPLARFSELKFYVLHRKVPHF